MNFDLADANGAVLHDLNGFVCGIGDFDSFVRL